MNIDSIAYPVDMQRAGRKIHVNRLELRAADGKPGNCGNDRVQSQVRKYIEGTHRTHIIITRKPLWPVGILFVQDAGNKRLSLRWLPRPVIDPGNLEIGFI